MKVNSNYLLEIKDFIQKKKQGTRKAHDPILIGSIEKFIDGIAARDFCDDGTFKDSMQEVVCMILDCNDRANRNLLVDRLVQLIEDVDRLTWHSLETFSIPNFVTVIDGFGITSVQVDLVNFCYLLFCNRDSSRPLSPPN